MALKKQYDFSIHGKGVLTDPTLPLTSANLGFATDVFVVNGVSYDLTTLDSTSKTSINTAIETIVDLLCNLTQTISLGSASVANGETVTITADGVTVTYTNSSGSAVAGTAAALATALKAVCDASAEFTNRFDVAISGNNLVLTQKAPQKKIALAVVAGTGITGADSVTVA